MRSRREAAHLTFDALERWEYPRVKQYTYDYISDADIRLTLASPELATFELAPTWSELTCNDSTLADNAIHPMIIAKLVSELLQGSGVPPVTIIAEEDIRDVCGYCVSDGHHRLRALKFLHRHEFSAALSGDEKALQQLIGSNESAWRKPASGVGPR